MPKTERGPMNSTVIIVSKLIESKNGTLEFPFNGLIGGVPISRALLSSDKELTVGVEYLMHVKNIRVEGGVIYGDITKFKELEM